jgi:hypothetical protein
MSVDAVRGPVSDRGRTQRRARARPLSLPPCHRPRMEKALRAPSTVVGRAAARASGALERELASAAPEGRDDGPTIGDARVPPGGGARRR